MNNRCPGHERQILKALVVDGVNRTASENANAGDGQVDRVLQPNTAYYRADGETLIGVTSPSRLFTFPLVNSPIANSYSFFTGLTASWQPESTAANCTGWSSSTGSGRTGTSDQSDSTLISSGSFACNAIGVPVHCVQQL